MNIATNNPEIKALALSAFPNYKGRTFEVREFSPMRLDSCWDCGSKSYYVILDLATRRQVSIPENGTPFSNGGRIFQASDLPVNFAIVEHCIFCGKDLGIRVYVGADNLAKMLPPAAELTRDEAIVLVATRSLKAFARFNEAQQDTGITRERYDAAKASLISKGMLNRAGAITNDGRNACPGKQLYQIGKE